MEDLSILSGGDWFASILERPEDGGDFGVAVDSFSFAESLRSLFIGAREVHPAPRL